MLAVFFTTHLSYYTSPVCDESLLKPPTNMEITRDYLTTVIQHVELILGTFNLGERAKREGG